MPRNTTSEIYPTVPPIIMEVKEDKERVRPKPNRKRSDTALLKRIPLNKLMDLKVDYAFKQLFGTEKNKQITVVFLNAILQKTNRNSIKDIIFINVEEVEEYDGDKQSRLDIIVETETGERINVEIQFTDQHNMINRSIYYWSGIYRRQMKKSMAYKELRPVIAINIMNFNYLMQTDRFHTTYHLYEDEEKFKLTELMEFHFIEMPKLIQAWKKEQLDPWNDILARWLLLLGIVDRKNKKVYDDIFQKLEEIAMNDKSLESAFKNWEELSMNDKEYAAYEARLKYILDEEAAKREMELRLKEGLEEGRKRIMKEGLEQGLEQGLQQGIKQGLQEGLEEGLEQGKKIANETTARRLLSSGMAVEEVANFTELTVSRVVEIKRELKKK